MRSKYSLSDLSDGSLDRGIDAWSGRRHAADAMLLAFIAEYDSRRRYVAKGFDSMHAFCVQVLGLSEDSAYKRIQAARVALEFPGLFPALGEGRLHLTAVNLLAPHLSPETADELIAASSGKSKAQIRQLLAERFPQEPPSRMSLLAVADGTATQGEPARAASADPAVRAEAGATQLAPAQVEEVDCWARVTPLSGDRYSVTLTIDRATLELLRRNQSLLSHVIPSGNLAEVLRRALTESARQLEKRKYGAAGPARRAASRNADSRYVPKHVRAAVRKRDGDRCTYAGDDGHRCGSRKRLELDHIVPIARGGLSTVDNLRQRCRAHNQLEAERVFGAEFMGHKRERARKTAEARVEATASEARATAEVPTTVVAAQTRASDPTEERSPGADAKTQPARNWIAEARARAAASGQRAERDELDVVPWLRRLGIRADDARRAATWCESIPEAPLEERVRVALSFVHAKASPGHNLEGPRISANRSS